MTATFRIAIVSLTALAATATCTSTAPRSASQSTTAVAPPHGQSPADQANTLFENYFEERIQMSPMMATMIGDNRFNDRLANSISPEWLAKSREVDRSYLEKLRAIDPSGLGEQDRLSYDILVRNLEISLAGDEYPGELLPINQFFSLPSFVAQFGSGQSAQPFATVADYDNWLSRLDDFVVWVDQAIANMRRGVAQGVVQPRAITVKVLPQLAAHVATDVEKSAFYMPIANMPETFAAADRQRLEAAYRSAIQGKVVPAYQRLHDYLKDEYLPRSRDSVGWSALPNGKAWYDYMVRTTTTTDLGADQLHQIGLDEVARIQGEMKKVMSEVGFTGTLAEWFEHLENSDEFHFASAEDVLAAFRALESQVDARIDTLFATKPKAGFEIRPVEAFRAESFAGAEYRPPSTDGSRPGVFYVNTHNLEAQPTYSTVALYMHEAVPGHHFQIAMQMELDKLPKIRRYGGFSAYIEGWGLYAESLGDDMGFYKDPMQRYGRLSYELLRAMRLVLDTGIHSKGWSREKSIEYMRTNSSMAESEIIAEVERYIAIPSQALAYKVGQLTISGMRTRAEKELGDKFDIRSFHTLILAGGALPLSVLESRFETWLGAQR